jgi:DNA-binding PadR family transcriptional regulator
MILVSFGNKFDRRGGATKAPERTPPLAGPQPETEAAMDAKAANDVKSPIKLQWFHILLALADGELHGYGIQRAVLERTGGSMRLWPAMLYRSLATLTEAGLIESVETPAGDIPDERRQYYCLTPAGRRRLRAETELMAGWVDAARSANTQPQT